MALCYCAPNSHLTVRSCTFINRSNKDNISILQLMFAIFYCIRTWLFFFYFFNPMCETFNVYFSMLDLNPYRSLVRLASQGVVY